MAIALVAFAVLSLAFAADGALILAMVQESTPPAFRGRVASLSALAFSGTVPIAGMASAALAAAIGLPAVMAFSALAALVATGSVLVRAAGGIVRVVQDCQSEYEAVTAAV